MKIIKLEEDNSRKVIDLFPEQHNYLLEMPQVVFKGVINKWTNHFGLVNSTYRAREIVLKQNKKNRELEVKREKTDKRNKFRKR